MKNSIISILSVAFMALFVSASVNAAHHGDGDADSIAPKSVIHVVTVSWKADAGDEAIQAALEGVKTLAEEYEGISRVWIRTIKAQGERTHAFVMEFNSEQALKDYAGSEAQENWYKVYGPVRERSTTFDITN